MLVGLLQTTLVNYPGRVAAAVFLPGCNLRCPFCHNPDIALADALTGPDEQGDWVSLDAAYAHLERRRGVLGGVAISGGEPLLSPEVDALIRRAKSLGLAVKLDTNGTLPNRLAWLLADESLRPDMVALDIKTSPERYSELLPNGTGTKLGDNLIASIAALATSGVKAEYRTVLVPGLVGESDLVAIAALMPADADWRLARFVSGHCLDPRWNGIAPYGPVETERLLSVAKSLVPSAELR